MRRKGAGRQNARTDQVGPAGGPGTGQGRAAAARVHRRQDWLGAGAELARVHDGEGVQGCLDGLHGPHCSGPVLLQPARLATTSQPHSVRAGPVTGLDAFGL